MNRPLRRPDANDELNQEHSGLRPLLHQLNNQLGIILANAELLEARLPEEGQRARASLVVAGALEAISSIQELRRIVGLRTNDV